MKTSNANFRNNVDQPHSLDVLIAYDDVDAAKRAKELCDRVSQSLRPDLQFNLGVWKASMFRFPEISRAAANARAKAVAIILVLDGRKDLAPELQAWIAGLRASGRSERDCSLVVLLHHIQRRVMDSALAYVWLRQYAQNGGWPFFADVIEPAENELSYSIESIHRRAFSHTPILDEILQDH